LEIRGLWTKTAGATLEGERPQAILGRYKRNSTTTKREEKKGKKKGGGGSSTSGPTNLALAIGSPSHHR